MDIVFGNVTYLSLPIIKILKYFKLNVYYISIKANEIKKIEIANELKYNSIYPLPLEFEKKDYRKISLCFMRK